MADKNISYVPPTHGKRVDDKKIEEGEECKYNNSFIKLVSFEFSHQGQNLKKKKLSLQSKGLSVKYFSSNEQSCIPILKNETTYLKAIFKHFR